MQEYNKSSYISSSLIKQEEELIRRVEVVMKLARDTKQHELTKLKEKTKTSSFFKNELLKQYQAQQQIILNTHYSSISRIEDANISIEEAGDLLKKVNEAKIKRLRNELREKYKSKRRPDTITTDFNTATTSTFDTDDDDEEVVKDRVDVAAQSNSSLTDSKEHVVTLPSSDTKSENFLKKVMATKAATSSSLLFGPEKPPLNEEKVKPVDSCSDKERVSSRLSKVKVFSLPNNSVNFSTIVQATSSFEPTVYTETVVSDTNTLDNQQCKTSSSSPTEKNSTTNHHKNQKKSKKEGKKKLFLAVDENESNQLSAVSPKWTVKNQKKLVIAEKKVGDQLGMVPSKQKTAKERKNIKGKSTKEEKKGKKAVAIVVADTSSKSIKKEDNKITTISDVSLPPKTSTDNNVHRVALVKLNKEVELKKEAKRKVEEMEDQKGLKEDDEKIIFELRKLVKRAKTGAGKKKKPVVKGAALS